MWFKTASEKVRLDDLERRVAEMELKFPKMHREVLEATETLDRITKRSFRLKEQLLKLEGTEGPKAENSPPNRHDLLRRA